MNNVFSALPQCLCASASKIGISVAHFVRMAVRDKLPAKDAAPWMRYAGDVQSGDPNSSQTIDEIVYGAKD